MAILVTCFVLLSLPRLSLSAPAPVAGPTVTPAPPPCSSPVDVAFLIDSSGSISGTNYQKEKNFVKEVAKSFGVAPGRGQAAIVLYSTSASVKARFGQYPTAAKFGKAVDGLPHERGFTRIDRALGKATKIFPEGRAGVPKIVLLITDGTQTRAANAKDLKEASLPLRKAGIRVLAVGVGRGYVDADELRLITETDDDVVIADDFQDLLLKLRNLTSKICDLAVTVPGPTDGIILARHFAQP